MKRREDENDHENMNTNTKAGTKTRTRKRNARMDEQVKRDAEHVETWKRSQQTKTTNNTRSREARSGENEGRRDPHPQLPHTSTPPILTHPHVPSAHIPIFSPRAAPAQSPRSTGRGACGHASARSNDEGSTIDVLGQGHTPVRTQPNINVSRMQGITSPPNDGDIGAVAQQGRYLRGWRSSLRRRTTTTHTHIVRIRQERREREKKKRRTGKRRKQRNGGTGTANEMTANAQRGREKEGAIPRDRRARVRRDPPFAIAGIRLSSCETWGSR